MKVSGAISFLVPALLLLAVPASAVQSRPDFSGEWMKIKNLEGGTTGPA